MRRRISPARRRRWMRPGLAVCALLAVLYYCLPYDSTLRLSVRFNSQRVVNSFAQPPRYLEAWTLTSITTGGAKTAEAYHVPAFYDDVGVVLKTGYGTQHRVPAQLRALRLRPHAEDADNVVVVGDFAGRLEYTDEVDGDTAHSITIHDVIAPVLASGALGPRDRCARAEKYRALAAAVAAGDDAAARRISQTSGWELDAMKFIPGLELAYAAMPTKSFYLLLDDDTFVIPASLRLLLAHLDPAAPHYVGNAVGDFRGRFAHGGSAVVLSRAAVELLLGGSSGGSSSKTVASASSSSSSSTVSRTRKGGSTAVAAAASTPRSALVRQAYVDSVTETWGDKLLATTLLKVGVYLDERFARLFNGARPRATRVSADRFCMPLVSFHALAQPAQMDEVGARFGGLDNYRDADADGDRTLAPAVAWGDLWALYGRPTVAALRRRPIRRGMDFVGRPGDDSSSSALVTTTTENVGSAEACRVECVGDDGGDDGGAYENDSPTNTPSADGGSTENDRLRPRFAGLYSYNSKCLAWTWDAAAQTCTTAPWFVVGEDAEEEGEEATARTEGETLSSSSSTKSTKYSGVNVALLRQLVGRCGRRDGVAWEERDGVYRFAYNSRT